MEIWQAMVLGVIQGLTEFLPVSSSGHLELANWLLGIQEPSNLPFTIAVHAGTVLSTIVIFARELGRLFRGLFKFQLNQETIFCIHILISLVPLLFVGLFLKEQIEALFTSNLALVGSMLLVTAGLLSFAHFAKPRNREMTLKSSFIIGIAQAVAVIPGLSRSGATISAGLMQGLKREETAKFSFLMVLIPVIGMNLLELFRGGLSAESGSVGAAPLLAGFLSAFVVGTLACKWMVRLVSRGKLFGFACYCAAVGIAAIVIYFL